MNTGNLLDLAAVCRALGVTPDRVRRLEQEGFLEAARSGHNRNGEKPLFAAPQVMALVPEMPRILSRWASEDNARLGARRAGINRAHLPRRVSRLRRQKEEFLASLEELPPKAAQLLKAAYYLFHLNHYAKDGHAYLYDLKGRVLRSFVRHFTAEDGLQVAFIAAESRVFLCPSCRSRAWSQGLNYADYARLYGGCSRCRKDPRYYDLYEFIINREEHRFIFHTPYALARRWIRQDLTVPTHYSQRHREAGYTFGRPVTGAEAQAVPLTEVIEELEQFVEQFSAGD
ncbi:MAG: hypothetical protein IMW93_06180 [Thermoanaerobacteraceae bacterium]|nr:hypothetical protein [Thermoanaerobacteraceae bacterium]